jgi:hypothetical protein
MILQNREIVELYIRTALFLSNYPAVVELVTLINPLHY